MSSTTEDVPLVNEEPAGTTENGDVASAHVQDDVLAQNGVADEHEEEHEEEGVEQQMERSIRKGRQNKTIRRSRGKHGLCDRLTAFSC